MTEHNSKEKELLINHLYHLHHHVNEYAKGMLTYFTVVIGGSIVALISFLSQYTAKENITAPDSITNLIYQFIGWFALSLGLVLLSWLFAFLQIYFRA